MDQAFATGGRWRLAECGEQLLGGEGSVVREGVSRAAGDGLLWLHL